MAAVDPYAPCPCGSGEKFKWCCHKIEAAIATLDEGLRKTPNNPWLLMRKVNYELEARKDSDPRATLERVFTKNPGHIEAHGINILATLERDGLLGGVKALQRALTA